MGNSSSCTANDSMNMRSMMMLSVSGGNRNYRGLSELAGIFGHAEEKNRDA
jgi:hypothetical protein